MTNTSDPVHNILSIEKQCLESFFNPKTIAIVGASDKPESVGRTLLWNLLSSPFGGTVYPVNPNKPSVLGLQTYPNLQDIPVLLDLVVIVTPAHTVTNIVKQCGELSVKSILIISAGFKEVGDAGKQYEEEILYLARKHNMRIIGPNCLGIMNANTGLNATFANDIARPGSIGFISQSGALCTSVLDWSLEHNVGFSKFLSIGSMLDVDWGDLIDYLGNDPETQSILIYMETIGNARAFMSAAREIALFKPIIIIKPGRTTEAAQAAASHTGSLAGSDKVLDAAFKRAGVIRVDTIGELFAMAEVLGKQPRPKGNKLTIITNAGGPGVLATDALIQTGGKLSVLGEPLEKSLNTILPSSWSHNNPIDILGDAGPERYVQAFETVLEQSDTDGIMVILTPQAMTNPLETIQALAPIIQQSSIPVLTSWMGGRDVRTAQKFIYQQKIPTYAFPDEAAKVFSTMCHYADNLKTLYETPSVCYQDLSSENLVYNEANSLIQEISHQERTILTEWEAKKLLSLYQIYTVPTRIAYCEEEALNIANEIGYPVVLKLHSETITHKSDINGVQLNLSSSQQVRSAFQLIQHSVSEKAEASDFLGVTVQPMISTKGYELILGSSVDTQFGPVILFGSGGKYVEIYQDNTLALPPLNSNLASRMIEQTKVVELLKGTRGQEGVNLDELAGIIVRFSKIVINHPQIKEIEINPLLASSQGFVALDARIILFPSQYPLNLIPQPAIRPYPAQYCYKKTLENGKSISIRPISPEDENLMIQFHQTLSVETIYQRYQKNLSLQERINHQRLSRICFNDYDREIALIAIDEESAQIIGIIRLKINFKENSEGTIQLLIADAWQKKGVGSQLLKLIIKIAKKENLKSIQATISPDNQAMKSLLKQFGFDFHPSTLHTEYTEGELSLESIIIGSCN